MIDNEKLRISHRISVLHYANPKPVNYSVTTFNESCHEQFDCIEELIQKLQELIKPQPKYKIGDEVWVVRGDQIIHGKIVNFTSDGGYHLTETPLGVIYEDEIYLSREDLVQARLEYWSEKLNGQIENVRRFMTTK